MHKSSGCEIKPPSQIQAKLSTLQQAALWHRSWATWDRPFSLRLYVHAGRLASQRQVEWAHQPGLKERVSRSTIKLHTGYILLLNLEGRRTFCATYVRWIGVNEVRAIEFGNNRSMLEELKKQRMSHTRVVAFWVQSLLRCLLQTQWCIKRKIQIDSHHLAGHDFAAPKDLLLTARTFSYFLHISTSLNGRPAKRSYQLHGHFQWVLCGIIAGC